MLLPAILVASYAALATATTANLTLAITPSSLLPNPSTLPPSTHAILLGPPGTHRFDAPLRRDNTLQFTNLSPASYLLTVHSRDYFFAPLRVDVTESTTTTTSSSSSDSQEEEQEQIQPGVVVIEAWQTFRGNEWSNKGPLLGTSDTSTSSSSSSTLTISIKPVAIKDFYQTRGGFSLMSFFKNPMILMGLVSAVMIFGMPYLMDSMDEETKAEFEEMSAKSPLTGSGGAANQLQNFDLASWMAGSGSSKSVEAPSGGGGKKK